MSGLSPVIITVRMPMTRICSKRSRIPGLTVSLSSITPRMRPPSDDRQRRLALRARAARRSGRGRLGTTPAFVYDAALHRVGRALANRPVWSKSTPDIRVCAVNGISCASRGSAVVQPFSCARSTIDRPSGVSSARDDSSAASTRSPSVDPGQRVERRRPPVAVGDRAGLVEQQGRHVAGRLDRATGECEHVALHEAIHPGDADRREQRTDRRRDETDEQGDEHDDLLLGPRVDREGLQRHEGDQEDDRQARRAGC